MPQDTSLLEAALVGYQSELARIEASIADIKNRLGKSGGSGELFLSKQLHPSLPFKVWPAAPK
jgi:hypothetical protein